MLSLGRNLLLGCVLAASMLAARAAATVPEWQPFVGTWVPRSGAAGTVRDAEEHALEPMNFLSRAIARKRLRDRFPPPGPITFSVEAGLLVVRFDGSPAQRIPLDGSRRVQDGVTFRLEFDGGLLRHTGAARNGTRENVFEFDAASDRLTMRTIIASPRLPRPVRYVLEFKRAAALRVSPSPPAE